MRLSVRTAQVSLLLAVLLGTALLVGGTAYMNMRFALEDLSAVIERQAFARVTQFVENMLDVAQAQGETNEVMLARGVIDPRDHEKMTPYFHGAIAAQPSLSYISYATHDGRYWHVYRDEAGHITAQWFLPDGQGGMTLTDFEIAPDGSLSPTRVQENSNRTCPTCRPYFIAAKEARRSTWPETYVFVGAEGQADIPGITRATPVYGEGGTFLGVATADFDVLALCKYLREVDLGERGLVFILERRGDGSLAVVAHPGMPWELEITRPAEGGGRELMPAEDVEDPRVGAVLGVLPSEGAVDAEGMRPLKVTVDGEAWMGAWGPLPGADRPHWIIAVMAPEEQVLGRVNAMRQKTIWVALGGVFVVLVLSLLISAKVSKRLSAISDETTRIANFELAAKPALRSRIREIDRLGTAQEEMKAGLRSFQKFVPSELVRSILASGQEAVLGGERKRITVFFSDIASFTKIAESLPPETLVELLAEYLGAMTRAMLERGATVDKYIGDAIMSFWGAPHEAADQAWLGCQAALANQRELRILRARWLKAGHPQIHARIGLHTGDAIVGNFGSENRLDYTAIGDTVNLGSRLEGLNKHYGTWILMSETTYGEVAERVVARRIDKVQVFGREEGLWVYELVGLPDEVDESTHAKNAAYEAALARYIGREFDEAGADFATLLETYPDDGPSKVMLARCMQYAQNPPPADWDGVFAATGK